MYPSDRMISPDPVPLPPFPLAEIVTTEGMTSFATETTLQTLTWADPADPAELDVELGAGDAEDFVAATITPPMTPPTTSAAPNAAHGNHPRVSRPCFLGPLIPAPCCSVSPKLHQR
jgi:hypothetical protein